MIRIAPLFGLVSAFLVLAAGTTLAQSPRLDFSPVPVPATDTEKRAVTASSQVRISGGPPHAIGYHVIARSGDRIGGGTFGLLVDRSGRPVLKRDGTPHVSNNADFSSLTTVDGRLFAITHFESRPGAMYLTELRQEPSGKLVPTDTRSIDAAAQGGLWTPCAGMVTPWNSHLGSEEYPPDARAFGNARSWEEISRYIKPMARYFGLDPFDADLDTFRKVFTPYAYGYPVEVSVAADGSPSVAKRHAMGRVSVELAYVMPDRRTAYITDDGTNTGLYMFVADRPGDLSAGHLYAAKWIQTGAAGGGTARIEWIGLGHATEETVTRAIHSGVRFADLFDSAPMSYAGTCPGGFLGMNTMTGAQCLRVRPGMEILASRLETRRFAALRGATTEFRKEEGIAFDAETGTLYVAMSEISKGMEGRNEAGRHNRGGPDHIRLPYNACGAVYALDMKSDKAIGSDFVAQTMRAVVTGRMERTGDNACALDRIANPDNLGFIPGYGTLIIAEDSGKGHQNSAMWAYDMASKRLTRILTAPYGAEITSPHFRSGIGGYGYLMGVIQHPYGGSDRDKLRDPADARAWVGYIGPFPAMDDR